MKRDTFEKDFEIIILNEVPEPEKKKLEKEFPLLDTKVFSPQHDNSTNEPGSFNINLGMGTFSSVVLCKLAGRKSKYFALRRSRSENSLKKMVPPVDIEQVEFNTAQESLILEKIKKILPEQFSSHVSLPRTTISTNNHLNQILDFASYGNGNRFKQLIESANIKPKTRDKCFNYIARTLIGTLNKLHENGFYIRDIKPSNLLFCPKKGVRFADFGSAIYYAPNGNHISASPLSDVLFKHPILLKERFSTDTTKKNFSSLLPRQKAMINDLWALGISLLLLYNPSTQRLAEKLIDLNRKCKIYEKSVITKYYESVFHELQQLKFLENYNDLREILFKMIDFNNLHDLKTLHQLRVDANFNIKSSKKDFKKFKRVLKYSNLSASQFSVPLPECNTPDMMINSPHANLNNESDYETDYEPDSTASLATDLGSNKSTMENDIALSTSPNGFFFQDNNPLLKENYSNKSIVNKDSQTEKEIGVYI